VELDQNPDWLEVYYGPLLIGWIDLKKRTLVPDRHWATATRNKNLKPFFENGALPQTPGFFAFLPGFLDRKSELRSPSRNPGR